MWWTCLPINSKISAYSHRKWWPRRLNCYWYRCYFSAAVKLTIKNTGTDPLKKQVYEKTDYKKRGQGWLPVFETFMVRPWNLTCDSWNPPNSFSLVSVVSKVFSMSSKPSHVMLDIGLDTPVLQSSDIFVECFNSSDLNTSSSCISTGETTIKTGIQLQFL